MKQSGNKKVNNNKNIIVLAIKISKVIIIIVSVKSVVEKLLSMSIKLVLVKDKQDINMTKVWI